MTASLGSITMPIFTRMNDDEIQLGEITIPTSVHIQKNKANSERIEDLTAVVSVGRPQVRMIDDARLTDSEPHLEVVPE